LSSQTAQTSLVVLGKVVLPFSQFWLVLRVTPSRLPRSLWVKAKRSRHCRKRSHTLQILGFVMTNKPSGIASPNIWLPKITNPSGVAWGGAPAQIQNAVSQWVGSGAEDYRVASGHRMAQ